LRKAAERSFILLCSTDNFFKWEIPSRWNHKRKKKILRYLLQFGIDISNNMKLQMLKNTNC